MVVAGVPEVFLWTGEAEQREVKSERGVGCGVCRCRSGGVGDGSASVQPSSCRLKVVSAHVHFPHFPTLPPFS
jgi:hypothetical protein